MGRADLIERARRGDGDAFGALAGEVVDRLYATAVRVLGNRDDAEDAVQSALVDAWRDVPKLRDAQRFDAWLYRLLIRSCYEHAGRRRRFSAQVRELRLEPSSSDSSSTLADRDEMERAFIRLSVEQRAVVVLHHYQSLTLKETADALGIAEGTARSRFHYALKTLRAAIEADGREAVTAGELA